MTKKISSLVFEALQANMAGGLPPIDPESGRGVTHDLWIPIGDRLPDHDRLVEVWNTGIDQVEDAFFDPVEKRWHSQHPLTVYMFGEITHWREKA